MLIISVVQVCEAEYLYETRTRQMSISVSCRFVRLNAAISVNLKPNEDGEYAEVYMTDITRTESMRRFGNSILVFLFCCVVFSSVVLPATF